MDSFVTTLAASAAKSVMLPRVKIEHVAFAQAQIKIVDRFQRAAFDYFLEEINPANGLVADTTRKGSPASIAVVGFALSSYPVAVERGWITRQDAAARTLVTLRFFWSSRQSEEPDATG